MKTCVVIFILLQVLYSIKTFCENIPFEVMRLWWKRSYFITKHEFEKRYCRNASQIQLSTALGVEITAPILYQYLKDATTFWHKKLTGWFHSITLQFYDTETDVRVQVPNVYLHFKCNLTSSCQGNIQLTTQLFLPLVISKPVVFFLHVFLNANEVKPQSLFTYSWQVMVFNQCPNSTTPPFI